MPRALILALFRMTVLIALAVSAALLSDYTSVNTPAFCAVGSGCDLVRESRFSHIMGIPVPIFGVIAFACLFGTSFVNKRKDWMFWLAVPGAIFGLGFLGIQHFILHTFCKLCVVVDIAVIIAAVLAYLFRRDDLVGSDEGIVPAHIWSLAGVISFFSPFLFVYLQPPPPVKPAVLKYWAPDKLTIVELSDFECPFCRMLHPDLIAATDDVRDRVKLVRIPVALPGHPHARPATKIYLCAADAKKGEEAAHLLFTVEIAQATATADSIAVALGLDPISFRKCIDDPATDRRVDEEYRKAKEDIGFQGLPTLWIGTEEIKGAVPAKTLKTSIAAQLSGGVSRKPNIPSAYLWSALAVALVGLTAASSRTRSKS